LNGHDRRTSDGTWDRLLAEDQKERRAGRSGRRPGFGWEAYRRRNVVERCVNRIKHWRGIATRYEKRVVNYRAMVVIASLMLWLPS
jgi:transposase